MLIEDSLTHSLVQTVLRRGVGDDDEVPHVFDDVELHVTARDQDGTTVFTTYDAVVCCLMTVVCEVKNDDVIDCMY